MPVILITSDDLDTWLSAPWEEAKALQRKLPDVSLKIIARGVKKDEGSGAD
jgi:putative SOS response-associated peptidase YedK